MRKPFTTFFFITIAFLIYPLSLLSQNSFSLWLDANNAGGDQAVTSLNTAPNRVVFIQVFGRDVQNANGISVRFEYDASQVVYEGFDAGNVLPNAHALPEHGTGFVEIGMGVLGGQSTISSGLVGTIRFRTTATFSGTVIRLVRGVLGRGGQLEAVTLTARVELQSGSVAAAPSPDFNGDGIVNIDDFAAFVNFYGTQRGDGTYQAKYDLDSNDIIGVSDLLIFIENYGKQMPAAGGGSGGNSGDMQPANTPFDLDSNHSDPFGITYVNNRFYIVDNKDAKVYVYRSSGQRDSSLDFDLNSLNSDPEGITYANDRFYVLDSRDAKVYVYRSSGQRDLSLDFDLNSSNSGPEGIIYANNRFYVLDRGTVSDRGDEKVYAYTSSGQRDAAADFNLDSNNSTPSSITYANNRFYVVDFLTEKVYAYTSSGQRDAAADFDLDENNTDPFGITYVNNRFYVVDNEDDQVYVYTSSGQSGSGGGGGSGGSSSPDLIVESLSVSDATLTPGQSFTLRATVRNQGNGPSAATTLRYYRSSNATISTSDTEVGTDSVGGLSASNTSTETIGLNAPSSAGTYYYGACVDNVSGESDTDNNCSAGVRVTVQGVGDDHGNTRSGATSLSLGGSRSGRIETSSDVDYFRVQVSNSGVLTVYTTSNLDTYGTLENSSGSTLASNDDDGSGYNFRIAYSVNAGTYYIKVEGYSSSDTGDYTVYARFVSGGSNQEVYSLYSRNISVAFSPDGRYIAAGDDEGYVALWEVSSGTNLWRKSLGGEVASVAFSPDGRYLAADGSDSNGPYVVLLGASSGTEIQRTGVDATSSDADRVNSVAFSPDGNYVAIGVDLRWASLWELSSSRRSGWGYTEASEVYAVAFSPDGRYLATGDDNGYAVLWEVSTWWTDDVNAQYMEPGGNVQAVAFSPDGRYLATDGYDGSNTDITIWEVSSGTRVRQINADNVFAIAFRPDGRYLAAGDEDGIITFWRTDGWIREKQIETSVTVTDLAWSPGGNLISDGKKVYQPLLSR